MSGPPFLEGIVILKTFDRASITSTFFAKILLLLFFSLCGCSLLLALVGRRERQGRSERSVTVYKKRWNYCLLQLIFAKLRKEAGTEGKGGTRNGTFFYVSSCVIREKKLSCVTFTPKNILYATARWLYFRAVSTAGCHAYVLPLTIRLQCYWRYEAYTGNITYAAEYSSARRCLINGRIRVFCFCLAQESVTAIRDVLGDLRMRVVYLEFRSCWADDAARMNTSRREFGLPIG